MAPHHRGLVRRPPPGAFRHPSFGRAGSERREKSRGLVRSFHRRPHPSVSGEGVSGRGPSPSFWRRGGGSPGFILFPRQESGGNLPGDQRPLRLRLSGLHRYVPAWGGFPLPDFGGGGRSRMRSPPCPQLFFFVCFFLFFWQFTKGTSPAWCRGMPSRRCRGSAAPSSSWCRCGWGGRP